MWQWSVGRRALPFRVPSACVHRTCCPAARAVLPAGHRQGIGQSAEHKGHNAHTTGDIRCEFRHGDREAGCTDSTSATVPSAYGVARARYVVQAATRAS